jgi:hypothetical protein
MKQQVHVAERVGRQDDEVGGLLEFPPPRIEIGNADGLLAGRIEIDLQHDRVGP